MASELEQAIYMAVGAHWGQVGKDGLPYILHPLHVMAQVETVEAKIVAVLHDVVEDTGATLDQLRSLGFSCNVITAIDAISRRKGEDYFHFIQRCGENPLAAHVKIHDLEHNMDMKRLPGVKDRDNKRLARYQEAQAYLLTL